MSADEHDIDFGEEGYDDGYDETPIHDVEPEKGAITDLYGWMSQWDYDPGIQYVRLERVFPREFPRGSSNITSGFIGQLSGPISEQELRQIWGGGHYILSATQIVGDGTSTSVVDRQRLRIQGNPAAVPDQNGNPIAIQQKGSPDMGVYNQNMPNQGLQTTGVMGGNPGILAALGNRRQSDNNANQLKDMAEIIQKTAEREEGAAERERRHREQLELELMKVRNEMMEPLREQVKNLTQQLDEERQARLRERSEVDSRLRDAKSEARDVLRDRETQLTNTHTREISELRAEYSKREETYRRQSEKSLADLKDHYRDRIESLNRELSEARNKGDTNRQEALRHADEQRRREVEDLRRTSEARISDLQESLREERERARADREAHTDAMRELRANHAKELADSVHRARTEGDTLHQSQVNTVTTAKDSEIAVLHQRVDEKQARIDNLTDELGRLRDELREKSDPMRNMEQTRGMIGLANEIRGPQGPQAPTDFLGKLAAHGGAVKENLLDPLLERYDNTVDLARNEQRRRADMQNAVRENRQRRQHPQKRVAQEPHKIGSGAPQRRAQQPQQQQPLRQQPQQQAPQAQGDNVEEQNAQVIGILNQWYTTGVKPNDAASQIKGAVTMGMVPKGAIDELKDQSTQQVVDMFQNAARQYGADALTTPEAEIWLEELHLALIS